MDLEKLLSGNFRMAARTRKIITEANRNARIGNAYYIASKKKMDWILKNQT